MRERAARERTLVTRSRSAWPKTHELFLGLGVRSSTSTATSDARARPDVATAAASSTSCRRQPPAQGLTSRRPSSPSSTRTRRLPGPRQPSDGRPRGWNLSSIVVFYAMITDSMPRDERDGAPPEDPGTGTPKHGSCESIVKAFDSPPSRWPSSTASSRAVSSAGRRQGRAVPRRIVTSKEMKVAKELEFEKRRGCATGSRARPMKLFWHRPRPGPRRKICRAPRRTRKESQGRLLRFFVLLCVLSHPAARPSRWTSGDRADAGRATFFYTALDVTNHSASPTDVTFKYVSSDLDRRLGLVAGLPATELSRGRLPPGARDKGLLTQAQANGTFRTPVTFANAAFTTGQETSRQFACTTSSFRRRRSIEPPAARRRVRTARTV